MPVLLQKKEKEVLFHLLSAKGNLVTRTQLCGLIWGKNTYRARQLDLYIHRLRKKLSAVDSPYTILTVRAHGWRVVQREEN